MISVIIPVYNDPEGLRDTLESVVGQDFPEEKYEVLPVDNNSTEDTGEVIEEFEDEYPGLVRGLEENEIQGSYAARNKGIEEAEGDILVFTDADMWWDEDVLSVVEREFSETDVDYLGGRIETVRTEDNLASLISSYEFQNTEKRLREANFVPTAFLAVSKEAAKSIDGFDERMFSCGDSVFGKKISEEGYKQDFSSKITAYHPTRDTFNSVIKKKVRLGTGHYEFLKYHPNHYIERHPLNIKNFLPTLPWRLKRTYKEWERLDMLQRLSFYFMYWAIKVAEPIGYLKGFLKPLKNSN